MKPVKIGIGLFFLAVVYLGYKSYVSIPYNYVETASAFARDLGIQQNNQKSKLAAFEKLKSSEDWAFLATYSEKENWNNNFVESKKHLSKAEKISDEVILPILDRDHEDDVGALLSAIDKGKSSLKNAKKLSNETEFRVSLILNGRKNKEEYYNNAKALLSKSTLINKNFNFVAQESIATFSHKTDDIEKKIAGLEALLAKYEFTYAVMLKEYQSFTPDFALYADTSVIINNIHKDILEYDEKNRVLLSELEHTYIKILADQKINYLVLIGRASWCEGESCGDGNQVVIPAISVDENTFEFFDNLTLDLIAKRTDGWLKNDFKLFIPDARWNTLGIYKNERLPGGYGYADYWVHKVVATTFHKYTYIIDGKAETKGWENVTNDEFWKQYDNLGMALLTKPLGYYESEMIDKAEPVGMATIATPTMVNGVPTGSNQYGEWRRDSSGTSFWVYYGMYRMFGDFMMPRNYYYNDWNAYNRNGRHSSFYGKNNELGTYGKSTYTNSRYRGGSFATRNPGAVSEARSGRSSRMQNSIRGAGSASRGKGPSGGGK